MSRCQWLGMMTLLLPLGMVHGQEGKSKPLILLDPKGKEMTLQNWKVTAGMIQPDWIAKETKTAHGADWLEFREHKTPMYEKDVTTYVPLSAVKQIDYDTAAREMGVVVIPAEGKEVTLKGSTRYKDINSFNLDGELAVSGLVSINDGFLKVGIHGVKFPEPRPAPAHMGGTATVAVRKDKAVQEIRDLMPLYKTKSGHRLAPVLMFQKTIRMELASVARMTHETPKDKKSGTFLDFEVEQRDGSKQSLVLMEDVNLDEKEAATLVGLLGRVPAGYRLFPATIIGEVTWKEAKGK